MGHPGMRQHGDRCRHRRCRYAICHHASRCQPCRGGSLPWTRLTERTERPAHVGVPLTDVAAKALKVVYPVKRGGARDNFMDDAGKPQPAGTVIRNRQFAAVLVAVGRDRPSVLSSGRRWKRHHPRDLKNPHGPDAADA